MYDWANSAFAKVVLAYFMNKAWEFWLLGFVIAFIFDITKSARLSILALTFFFVNGMLILARVKEEKQPAAAPPNLRLIFSQNL